LLLLKNKKLFLNKVLLRAFFRESEEEREKNMTELLSPAGNFEKMKAAFLYGADAVYLAAKRFGMQADVHLTASNAKCIHVKTGEDFSLRAEMTVPEGMGKITSVRYDFNDNWSYPVPPENLFPIEGKFDIVEKTGLCGAVSEINHHFDKPGTYFVSVRITSQRTGDADDPFTQIQNLDRVRIIVE